MAYVEYIEFYKSLRSKGLSHAAAKAETRNRYGLSWSAMSTMDYTNTKEFH